MALDFRSPSAELLPAALQFWALLSPGGFLFPGTITASLWPETAEKMMSNEGRKEESEETKSNQLR